MLIGTYSGRGGQYVEPGTGRLVSVERDEVKHRFVHRQIRCPHLYGCRGGRFEFTDGRCAGELRFALESHEGEQRITH